MAKADERLKKKGGEQEAQKEEEEDEQQKGRRRMGWRRRRKRRTKEENDKDEEEAPLTPAGCHLLHFTPSLIAFWPLAGSDFLPTWPLPLFFFPSRLLTSFTLIAPPPPPPRQSPAAAPVREPVCLAVGRRRLPLGGFVALQLLRRGSANEPPAARRQASARTSQLAQHFLLSKHLDVTNQSIFLLPGQK